jgi:hypothetical protein
LGLPKKGLGLLSQKKKSKKKKENKLGLWKKAKITTSKLGHDDD